jgi:starvation-inducible DNA-binding protein
MIHIGLDENICREVGIRLNKLLANEFVLYTRTLNYHWNVKGKHFGSLHTLFNNQYEQLLQMIDEIAERAQAIGVPAQATLQQFLQVATLKEKPQVYPDDMAMIKDLVDDHEIIIQQIRIDIDITSKFNDMGTNNFLCDLMEKHEKMAWMLRSHLQE